MRGSPWDCWVVSPRFSTAMVEAVQALLAARYARFVMLWLVQPTLSLIALITGYTAAAAVLLAVFSAR